MVTDYLKEEKTFSYSKLKEKYQTLFDSGFLSYCVGQHEKCPETKKDHGQLYIRTSGVVRFNELKKKLPYCHLQARKAKDWTKAKKYCTKEKSRAGEPFEIGTHPVNGKSSKLLSVAEEIKKGKSFKQALLDSPDVVCRNINGLKLLEEVVAGERPDNLDKIRVLCLYGPPGGGKTHAAQVFAKEICKAKDWPLKEISRIPPQGDWMDGAKGKIVIFEDFSGDEKECIGYSKLLNIVDKYPVTGARKGGFLDIRAEYIIFTSNTHPKEWYVDSKYNKGQLVRRFGDGQEKYTGVKFMDTREELKKFYVGENSVPDWDQCDAKW